MLNKNTELSIGWIDEFSRAMAYENVKIMKARGDKTSKTHDLLTAFIAHTIKNTILDGLETSIDDSMGPKEKRLVLEAIYMKTKRNIQESISNGFALASKQYSGVELEYSCNIALVGQPKNRMVC